MGQEVVVPAAGEMGLSTNERGMQLNTLYVKLLHYSLDPIRAEKMLAHKDAFDGNLEKFVDVASMFISHEETVVLSDKADPNGNPSQVISNHTAYNYTGSENFEHDDTGDRMNYSGVEDDINTALAEHEGWQGNYDY